MKKVITISREFGSGGRTIGKAVAQRLGFKYYDKEIIEKISEQTGLSKDYIKENGEYSAGKNMFGYAFVGRVINGMSVEDYLWCEQRKLIEEIAEEGNCVIVGRCADYILKDRKDCLHVFVHADMDFKVKRIVNNYGETDEKPEKRLMDKDKKRAVNYKYYTDGKWGASKNYDISLKSSELGIDTCVDVIVQLAKEAKEV
ncbi:MAG: cytidylate kinase-like family protein [Ruminococcus sp.]|nr:cytidylate kinase-like family protein [Ruminococcus sp.]